ncbi:MAG: C39 family peptidase [Oscillospiraceae bacterium]|nr:C39 family peptidase [Oscillospiraceae bacterium]
MKKRNAVVAVLIIVVLLIGIAVGWLLATQKEDIAGNYSDEMKMEYRTNYADGGANEVERELDHEDSVYFYHADFYNAKSGNGLYIIPNFKTIQQTSWWSCGVSCTEMVLNYFGKRGDWDEESLAALREDHEEQHIGTCLDQIIDMFQAVGGFELETTYDYAENPDTIDLTFIRERIAAGIPVIVGWNDWGGHWQVIIGYDTMGTETEGDDVIIVADPFDTTDHNQDGYGVYGAERFIYNFTFFDFFGDAPDHARDKCFVAVKPVQ